MMAMILCFARVNKVCKFPILLMYIYIYIHITYITYIHIFILHVCYKCYMNIENNVQLYIIVICIVSCIYILSLFTLLL